VRDGIAWSIAYRSINASENTNCFAEPPEDVCLGGEEGEPDSLPQEAEKQPFKNQSTPA
jgi:hypothetical protein